MEIKVFTKEQQKEHPQLTKEFKETFNQLKGYLEDNSFIPKWMEFDGEIYFDDYDYKRFRKKITDKELEGYMDNIK